MINVPNLGSRWLDYYYTSGDKVTEHWHQLAEHKNRKLLIVLGLGFDPRMCTGTEMLLSSVPGQHECLLINLNESPYRAPDKIINLANGNRKKLADLMKGRGSINQVSIELRSEGRWIGDLRARDIIKNFDQLSNYTDVIVDLSALPTTIYFVLISTLLFLTDHARIKGTQDIPNIHAIVSENASLDNAIIENGIDEKAEYLNGFSEDLEAEEHGQIPKVWIPLIGEGKLEQLERIHELILPNEICPILPSPSIDPRRSDRLVQQYTTFLFDTHRIDPSNFVFACEWNPFEAYRQISNVMSHYNRSLRALGGSRAVVSALSSKLLSIGALLAAYEAKRSGQYLVGVAHIEPRGYTIDEVSVDEQENRLYSLFLSGEAYETN